jgi:hypothetical protein
VVAEWPTFPDVYRQDECPEGMVCTTETDYDLIVDWIYQVMRIHQHLMETCPQVEWRPLNDVPGGPIPEPYDPNPFPEE